MLRLSRVRAMVSDLLLWLIVEWLTLWFGFWIVLVVLLQQWREDHDRNRGR